jgi:hypothetical protein
MSILKNQSRFRSFPLKGPQGESPPWVEEETIQFDLNNLPLLTRDTMANYVPALKLTAYGIMHTAGDDVERVTWEDMTFALYDSFDLQGAWHGRPIAAQHMRGATARIWEQIGLGYTPGARRIRGIRASSANQAFRHILYLPLSHGLGRNGPRYTAQLALLYKDANLQINTPANGMPMVTSPAAEPDQITIGAVQIRCSAVLLPEPSLRLGPGSEWLELQSKGASTGSDSVDLISLGNATALEGIEPGAGIDTMLALCDVEGLGGSFTADTLTQFSCPFTDQTQTRDLDVFVNMLEQVTAEGQRGRDQQIIGPTGVVADIGRANDFSGFPYGYTGGVPTTAGTALDARLLAFPIIVSGPHLETTKIQRFEGTSTYYRTSSDVTGDVDRTLIHQLKSWTPQKHEEFRQMLIQSGMAAKVLGTRDIIPKALRNEVGGAIDPALARYFPIEYVPAPDPNKKATAP